MTLRVVRFLIHIVLRKEFRLRIYSFEFFARFFSFWSNRFDVAVLGRLTPVTWMRERLSVSAAHAKRHLPSCLGARSVTSFCIRTELVLSRVS